MRGTGTVVIKKLVNNKWCDAQIKNVLYVPDIRRNLFSVGVCTTNGYEVTFRKNRVILKSDNKLAAEGIKQDNELYQMYFVVESVNANKEVNAVTVDFRALHERLGHVNKKTLTDMIEKGLISKIKGDKKVDFFCEACQFGKAHRLPIERKEDKIVRQPGELIHSDVGGPMSVESLGGCRFYVIFKDDSTGYRQVYFMRHKSKVLERLKEFEAIISNKFKRRIVALRSDNGREYCNQGVKQYLASKGITHKTTAPFTPEQNGKSERDNRTIVESARTMLEASKLPRYLWAEAVNTAVYIRNRIPTTQHPNSTPYELWTEKKANLEHLRIFGTEAYAHVPKQLRTKLDPKAKKVLLVGYQGNSNNYRLYNPVSL